MCVVAVLGSVSKQEGDRKSLVTASLVQGQIGVKVLSTDLKDNVSCLT